MIDDLPVAHSAMTSQSGRGVHNLGYRGWNGEQVPGWTRWMVIASVGVRRSWQNNWLKRMMLFAWLPAIGFGIAFFLWEQAALYPDWRPVVKQATHLLPQAPWAEQVVESVGKGDLASSRHAVWAYLLNCFFRYSQAVLMLLVVGLISPPLISQDIRSRAFLLYFSRPLGRFEYLLGKMAGIWVFLGMITAVPAIMLYFLGIALSPNFTVVISTWDLPLRILAASVVLMVPTSALALCLSSLTQESRYAGFAWFAIWILGYFTHLAVMAAQTFNAQQQAFHHRHGRFEPRQVIVVPESNWSHLSLYHTLGKAQSWAFGFESLRDIWGSVVVLVGLSFVSISIVLYRVSKPMRV